MNDRAKEILTLLSEWILAASTALLLWFLADPPSAIAAYGAFIPKFSVAVLGLSTALGMLYLLRACRPIVFALQASVFGLALLPLLVAFFAY